MDPIAQYTPREMLQMMEQYPLPTNFLSSMFVKDRNETNKTVLEIDKLFGGQLVAGFTSRQGGPNIVGKAGGDTHIHIAPYIYEQVPYTPSDVDVRQAGTTVYDNSAQYLGQRVERWLSDLENRFNRNEEMQIAEALQTGQVHVQGKDVDYLVDYDMKAGHLITLAGADMWDGTPDKLAQLEAWAEMIEDTGAPGPDVLVGERKAMNMLINDDDIKDMIDNRRIDRGEINVRLIRGQRATYLGTLRGAGLDIDLYSYQGMYETIEAGVKTTHRYMNDYTVILASTQQDFRFHYGKIENFETGDFIGQRFPNRWQTRDGKRRYLTMESSPLAGFHQPDAVVTVVVYTP